MNYQEFLNAKRENVAAVGFEVDDAALSPRLFDWQRHIVKWALRRGRAALFEDCGLGKTLFFRMINRDALIADIGTIMGWRQTEIEDYIINNRDCELVIDDIGCGGSKARDYGREFDALLMILNMRDPARCRFRTHFTTNLTNDEFVANFDARVVDRIYGLAKCFRIETEESRREAVAFI